MGIASKLWQSEQAMDIAMDIAMNIVSKHRHTEQTTERVSTHRRNEQL